MTERDKRLKQTERNLVAAKKKNTGVQPSGRPDRAGRDGKQPSNPGQTIVNSDQNSG